MEQKNYEKDSNQFLEFTKEVKKKWIKDKKLDNWNTLWKIILSDNKSGIYESNLMRRICGLLYFPDKLSGEIKLNILKKNMTYYVKDECIKCKLMDCVEVCPVDCFYEGENMLVIDPDECIDCGVCEPECPVDAIVPDTTYKKMTRLSG